MSNKLKDYANKVLQIDPLSDRLGNVGFTGGASKKLTSLKKQKIKKARIQAAGLGVIGAGIVAAGVKNIKNTLESEYGKEDKKK